MGTRGFTGEELLPGEGDGFGKNLFDGPSLTLFSIRGR